MLPNRPGSAAPRDERQMHARVLNVVRWPWPKPPSSLDLISCSRRCHLHRPLEEIEGEDKIESPGWIRKKKNTPDACTPSCSDSGLFRPNVVKLLHKNRSMVFVGVLLVTKTKEENHGTATPWGGSGCECRNRHYILGDYVGGRDCTIPYVSGR